MLCKLKSPRGEKLTTIPWDVYPRPQLRRDNWMNLNGTWDFAQGEEQPEVYEGKILVPFCPESALSGVEKHFPEGTGLWYRRRFFLPRDRGRGKVLLHIGAADQKAKVFVNGIPVGSHAGGYDAFTFDITHTLREENELVICCRDDLRDQTFCYGKQVMNRGGMWYTPVSGIWQTVWLEQVPEIYVEKLTVENRGYAVDISVSPALEGAVTVAGLGTYPLEKGHVRIAPEDPRLWSPEDPWLYDFTLEAGEDRLESYFAIRSLEVKQVGPYPRLCLNGEPYFFHGLLDQGYWPEGLLTAPAPESFADDILAVKKLGFNTLRKHIKAEPEEFYYQCDRLGMIVWQDMVNNSDYRFLRDTALPTVGFQKCNDRKMHRDPAAREEFRRQSRTLVEQLKNHPSVCYWTVFNEGWGQFDSDSVYDWFRSLDDTRFIDTTSGWFRQKESDVDSRHVYFRKLKLRSDGEKPLVLSEFGGKTYRAEGHVFNPDKTYGYGSCETVEALSAEVEKLYLKEVLPCVEKGLCAAIYTQVSDVEDEINGLLTYDRRVVKLRPEPMLALAKKLRQAVRREK